MRMVICGAVVLTTMMLTAAADGLRPEKMKGWTIAVAADASPSERYAAEEFQSLFEQATGVHLPIAAPAHRRGHMIYIGSGAAARAGKLGFDSASMGDEELRVRVGKKDIVIAGGRPRGTLYGVYEFFERCLGVRFLTCDHTYFPPRDQLAAIPEADFSYTPLFSFRWSYYKENADRPEFAARLRVNTVSRDEKLGGSTPQQLINHSLYKWISPDLYGKTHPEYFALVQGQRRLDVGGGGPQPCVTNPEVLDIVTAGVLKEIAEHPELRNFSVSQNDNDEYCHCPACEAINQREGSPMGAHLALVNAVAERVEKLHPEVQIGTLAYSYTRKPPKTIVPRKNVQIQLCSIECCVLHPIEDAACAQNRAFCEDLRAWKAVSDNIWVWNYNTNFGIYDLPLPNLKVIGPNVRFFQANHVKGLFMQANGNGNAGEMCDLRNYVIGRTLWNPQLDSWALVEEFCRLHYQEAAPPILEYLAALHDNAETLHRHPGTSNVPGEVGLTPEMSRKAFDLFAKARALAPGDAVRARVEKASICAYKAMLLSGGGTWQFENDTLKRVWPEPYQGLLDAYIDLCTKYNMSMATEQVSAQDYFVQARKLESMPARRIENEVWRITVAPEFNGKTLELFHKPSGRNMLAATTHDEILRGAHDEVALQGFASDRYTVFAADTRGNAITLSRTLEDGSTVERRIALNPAHPEVVNFESKVTHHGPEPKTYQYRMRPEWNAGTDSKDCRVLSVYVKEKAWKQVNQDWAVDKGPLEVLPANTKSSGFAWFNHESGTGMCTSYDPAKGDYPILRWLPALKQVNLDLATPAVKLKKGESLRLAYQFRYLTQPPR